MEFNEYRQQLEQLDCEFHEFEKRANGREWTLEQEALAYITEASAVGREIMAQDRILPEEVYDKNELGMKLAQNIAWIFAIAKHTDIDLVQELDQLLIGIKVGEK